MAERYADRYPGAPFREDDDGHAPRQQAQADNDPLAELARLIGQADPFAGLGQDRTAAPVRAAPVAADLEDAPALPSWMQRVSHREPDLRTDDGLHDAGFDAQDDADGQPVPQRYAPPQGYPAAQDYPAASGYPPVESGAYDDNGSDPERYDDTLYGAPESAYDPYANQPAAPFAVGAGYADQPDPYGYHGQSEEPVVGRRRGGMTTVVAVLALAFVGTAGAYAYRTMTGTPRNGEIPIIKADTSPNKVVPPTQDASGKQIQDRLASGQGGERIVSREEQPVDVSAPRQGPRVVFPPLTPNPSLSGTAAPPPRSAAAPNATNGTLSGDEPRKVRTVSIRPDQPEGTPQFAATGAPPPSAAKPVTTTRAAPSSSAAASAPMSLAPQSSAPTRVATTGPVSAPAPSSSGGYLVQIASQRSETDAQASYRALQGKYPSVLGSRTPLIKRADLGEKGIYYRAMVGPFASSDDASQFCGSLKSAGGQCVVQRN